MDFSSLSLVNSILFALAFLGIFFVLIFVSFSSNKGYGILTSYSLIAFTILFNLVITKNQHYSLYYLTGPLMIIALCAGIITQTSINLKVSNQNHIMSEYTNFNTIIALLMSGMIYLYLQTTINVDDDKKNNNILTMLANIIFFIISGFLIYLNQVILSDFTTDG